MFKPDRSFAALGDDYSTPVEPADFPKAREIFWNSRWADHVGLTLEPAQRAGHFARFEPLDGADNPPRAIKYHGHQFRVYNPEIGDGRGFLFDQLRDRDGRLLDLGTKGSGQTPFSRSGDGRLTLKGAVREILAAEMLEALGVYTSKMFSVFETGEQLHRGDEPSPTRSAVMTRLQHSHLRFGVFQRHAYYNDADKIEALIEYALTNLIDETGDKDGDRASVLLDAVSQRSARLVAQWMAAGFVHGVLNTDNLVVTGESFDYGPWRFLPHFDPGFTAAYFDQHGLYAYARQPEAVFWAVQQFAGALSLVGDREGLIETLSRFPDYYQAELTHAFHHRLGIKPVGDDSDAQLVTDLLGFMKATELPFEAIFFDWFCGALSQARAEAGPRQQTYRDETFAPVRSALLAREAVRPSRLEHAHFRRTDPVHMTIERVEGLWAPIAETDDWSLYEQTLADIAQAREAYDLGAGRIGFLREMRA